MILLKPLNTLEIKLILNNWLKRQCNGSKPAVTFWLLTGFRFKISFCMLSLLGLASLTLT